MSTMTRSQLWRATNVDDAVMLRATWNGVPAFTSGRLLWFGRKRAVAVFGDAAPIELPITELIPTAKLQTRQWWSE